MGVMFDLIKNSGKRVDIELGDSLHMITVYKQ